MKETYIVSGYMRTGTSMMMDALSKGGLDPVFNDSRERMNIRYGDKDYSPNPGGFYELSRKEYQQFGFPRMYEGRLLKCMYPGMWKLFSGNYKIIFMMRDPEEIRQSYEAFFDSSLPPSFKMYQETMDETINMLDQRRDVDLTVFQYRHVVESPLETFKSLFDNGWPIDYIKAASVVNSSLLRFKKEELSIGI